jgi:hypothetical protein
MIDPDVMQEYIRDANPIATIDDVDASELARFVALAQAAQIGLERGTADQTLVSVRAVPRRGPAVALGIAAVALLIVGVAMLLLRLGDVDTAPPANTPATTTPPTVSTTLATRWPLDMTLTPAPGLQPQRISTVVGDLDFVKLTSSSRLPQFYVPEATPFGLVAIDDNRLWWSSDYLGWESGAVRAVANRVSVVGDDVVVHGDQVAIRYVWDGQAWHDAGSLDIEGAQLISSGHHGTVVATYDNVFFSRDGRQFIEAGGPPTAEALVLAGEPRQQWDGMAGGCSEGIYNLDFEDSGIGSILATPDGFVALTAAHPLDWGEPKICEPIPWFSSDGDTWQMAAEESPFGDNAAILPKVTERNGRFVAVGSTDGENAAVWVSDDGLSWERNALDLEVIDAVAAGEAGWMITGVFSFKEEVRQVMFFSVDGINWDGPYDRPDGLTSGYLPPQLAVGVDAFFGIGGTSNVPVLGRLQQSG